MADNDEGEMVMHMRRMYVLLLMGMLFSSILNAKESRDSSSLEKVSVQFQWLNQFQFAGYYIAKEKGFYQDSGLDVELKEYKFGMDVAEEVLAGKSEFGVGRSSLIIEHLNEKKIVLLGAIFQRSPHILLSIKSPKLKSIADLKGKRVMITGDLVNSASIIAMLSNQGLSLDDIKRQEHSFDLNDLTEGKTDTMGAYISNEPYQLNKKGIEYTIFDPADYGFDLYSDLFFTSEKELSNHPNRVRAFYKATLKGWEYAFSHIEETAELIHSQYNTQNRSMDALVYEGEVLKEHAYVDNIALGHIDRSKIQRIADVYFIVGATHQRTSEPDFQRLLYSDYYDAKKLDLTTKELQWIEKHPVVRVGVNMSYPPFEYVEKMELKGMIPAYLNLLQERTGLKFQISNSYAVKDLDQKIKAKELDMIGLAVSNDVQAGYLDFTQPFLTFPMVIITQDNILHISDHEQLIGKKAVVAQGYPTQMRLASFHPELDLITVENVEEGLRMVSRGEAFAFVGSIATSSYYIKQDGLMNLKVSGDIPFPVEISMAVRKDWPELRSILQKAMDTLTTQEKSEINNRWLFVQSDEDIDYNLLLKIIFGLIILLFVPLTWAVLLRNQIRKRKAVENELKKALEKTQKLSVTDKLTGAYNRLHIDQFLEQEMKRSQRYGNPLAIVLIDIDDFKEVNDTYGHIVGDKILIQCVSTISAMIRRSDVFGRWGGEEFLLICTETDLSHALEAAEAIRSKIETTQFEEAGSKTVSIGVTSYVPTDTIMTILMRVDAALYDAKNTGKNKVVSR